MKGHIRIDLAPGGPFPGRFLHFVFAKDPVPLLQHRLDPLGGLYLGYGDQLGASVRTIGGGFCGTQAGNDFD